MYLVIVIAPGVGTSLQGDLQFETSEQVVFSLQLCHTVLSSRKENVSFQEKSNMDMHIYIYTYILMHIFLDLLDIVFNIDDEFPFPKCPSGDFLQ